MQQQQHNSTYTDDASLYSSSSPTTTTYSFTSRSNSTASTSTTPPPMIPPYHVNNTDNHYHSNRQHFTFQAILHHVLTLLVIALIAAIAITCLFVLFLVIQVLVDLLPRRMWNSVVRHFKAVNWLNTVTCWGLRLVRLIEWEKNRRASFYPSISQRFAHMDGTRLHRVLHSIILVLDSI
ncbi:hypothetical protein K492DRAFT_176918, partial [Lichtheimia hyalospora FSU 10163]